MPDRTPWTDRATVIGLSTPFIARATGVSVSAVEKYRYGSRRPPEAWLRRVDRLLTDVERAVEQKGDAA